MLEVVPNGEFYDYTAKYSENGAKHLQPDITTNIAQNIMENAVKMHKTLGLKDISRSEFLLTDKNDIIALEINSHPGFTATSIVPEIAINAGIKYEEIDDTQKAVYDYQNEKPVSQAVTELSFSDIDDQKIVAA